MAVFIISVLVIALVIAGMAIGVMAGRSPIRGSCGGISALGMAASCEICGGDTQRCDRQTRIPGAGASHSKPSLPAKN